MIFSFAQLEIFLLILARILGLFSAAPIFSSKSLNGMAKTALAIWITSVLWFAVPVQPDKLPSTLIALAIALISEVALGFLLGFLTNTIFIAIQAAGEIMDLQMGLSVASSFDPLFGATISIIGRLAFYIALLVFLLANGHHMLLSVIHQSFKIIPPGSLINVLSPLLTMQLLSLIKDFWIIAIQLAGPIVLLIFLSDFAFGIVSRVAPQVNVFQLGFQVKPSLGLIGLVFTMSIFARHIENLIGTMAEGMLKMLMVLR
ncbi:MAG: flagellar biosynthetic protein FliR [Candidatus Margulisiibacteriota bacterium]